MATTTEITQTTSEVSGWGLYQRAVSRIARPADAGTLATALREASERGEPVCLRAGGGSYGDAAILDGGLTLDCSAANRILAWDPQTGVATVEPGVTIAQLWRRILPDGWRPAVVPGRGAVTMAGAASVDIHGKNNWRIGSFGDHILSFELALPTGERVTCSRESRPDLFHAAIGGMGLLGGFTSITLRAIPVWSGLVRERRSAHPSLDALLDAIEAATSDATDLVAWVDASATGPALGRGLLAEDRDLSEAEDPHAAETLRASWERWPSASARLLRRLPSWLIPTLAHPMTTRAGAWLANRGQWTAGSLSGASPWRLVSYPAANFPLDVIPNWRDTYRPGGLIQHQAFIPAEAARQAFTAIITRAHAQGLPPSLAVLKKQRASDFLLSYLVDGYSLALDFPVARGAGSRLLALMRDLNDITLDHGGRLYFAKDSALTPEQVTRQYPRERLAQFARLKAACDPRETLQTALYQRALRPTLQAALA
jgi:decaprenylphospho-beta-D-ribofuranose 2-oxidase